jgi:predicted flavoprotein YhiN
MVDTLPKILVDDLLKQLSKATIQSNYPKQLFKATIQSNYPKQLSKAIIQSNYSKQLPKAIIKAVIKIIKRIPRSHLTKS